MYSSLRPNLPSVPAQVRAYLRRSASVASHWTIVLVALIVGGIAVNLQSRGLSFKRVSATSQDFQAQSLYVIDPNTQPGQGQVLVLGSSDGHVRKTIPTGLEPDFAVSPSGGRLFIVSRLKSSDPYDTLTVLDPATDKVLDSQVLFNRLHYTVMGPPTLAVSPDGRWLYIMKLHWTPGDEQKGIPQRDETSIQVYDSEQHTFVKGTFPLPGYCGSVFLLPSSGALNVLCSSMNEVFSFPSTPADVTSPRIVRLPSPPRQVRDVSPTTKDTTTTHPDIAGGVLSADGHTLMVVTTYMRAIQVDTATSRVLRAVDLRDDRWAMPAAVVASPDVSLLYIAVAPLSQRNRALGVDEILVLETSTLSQVARIHTSGTFWTLGMARDGRYLYAVSPLSQTVHVVDTVENREVRTLTGIGVGPSRLTVVP